MDFVCAVLAGTHTLSGTRRELTHNTFLTLELYGGGIDGGKRKRERGGRKGGGWGGLFSSFWRQQ